MKDHIAKTIADLKSERAKLDEIIATLERYGAATSDAPEVAVPAERLGEPFLSKTRKYTRRAVRPISTTATRNLKVAATKVTGMDLDKPTTVGGAMKLICKAYVKKSFTMQDVIAALEADKDYNKFYQESSGVSTVYANLAYWSKTGKLEKIGEGADATYKVLDLDF
jgi:uncharacterized protein YlxP (DUF503 family)